MSCRYRILENYDDLQKFPIPSPSPSPGLIPVDYFCIADCIDKCPEVPHGSTKEWETCFNNCKEKCPRDQPLCTDKSCCDLYTGLCKPGTIIYYKDNFGTDVQGAARVITNLKYPGAGFNCFSGRSPDYYPWQSSDNCKKSGEPCSSDSKCCMPQGTPSPSACFSVNYCEEIDYNPGGTGKGANCLGSDCDQDYEVLGWNKDLSRWEGASGPCG